jgi:hypothetical protein
VCSRTLTELLTPEGLSSFICHRSLTSFTWLISLTRLLCMPLQQNHCFIYIYNMFKSRYWQWENHIQCIFYLIYFRFVGVTCEQSVCEDNPCQFGSTCVPYPGTGFLCLCPLGKHGIYCENGKILPQVTIYFSCLMQYMC